MNTTKQKGWLMCLKKREDSRWGEIEPFLTRFRDNLQTNPAASFGHKVFGKLQKKSHSPKPGDGIAFYHTSRAGFPRPDRYKRRPRISLIGEILDVKQEGQEITRLEFRLRRADHKHLSAHPIIRNEETEHLFQECMRRGTAAYFEVPPPVWAEFLRLAGRKPGTATW